MAGSREFDGVGDDIRFALTRPNPASAVTQVLVLDLDAVGTDTYLSAVGYDPELGRDLNVLYYRSAGTISYGTSATSPTAGAWQVIAVAKAAGTVRPRFHRVVFGGAASHEDGTVAVGDVAASAPWVLGGDGDRGAWQLDGRCAAWAMFDRALSDGEVAGCTTWSAIGALAPVAGGIRLDGSPPFPGQTAINGTSHSADEPTGFWPSTGPAAHVNDGSGAAAVTTYVNVGGRAVTATVSVAG